MTLDENCSEAAQAAKKKREKIQGKKKEQNISGAEICQWAQKLPDTRENCYPSHHN